MNIIYFQSLEEYSDSLVEASDIFLQTCEAESSRQDAASKRLAEASLNGLKNTANCIFNFVAWVTKDVLARAYNYSDDDEVPNEVAEVLSLREKLVDVIHTWLGLETAGESNNDIYKRELQRTAFEIVGDLRLIHSQKLSPHVHLCALSWIPTKEFLDDLRRVFEAEEEKIRLLATSLKEQISSESSDPSSSATAQMSIEQLGDTLTDGLLRPLSQSMVYDPSSINRRQAAAILVHIMDPIDSVQKYVKDWVRKLKENSISKYLEIQLVTLKGFFEKNVMDLVANLNADDDRDDEAAEAGINTALEAVGDLSRRLSQTMGVGKVKGDALEALGQFFILGLEFAFAEEFSVQLNFLRILAPYLKLLQAEHLRTVSEYFDDHIEKHSINLDDQDSIDKRFDLTLIFQSLTEFKAALGGKKITRSRAVQVNRSAPPGIFSKPIVEVAGRKGIKSLEALDYEATQQSIDFDEIPATRSKRMTPSVKSSSGFPALGLHLEDIDAVDGDDEDEDVVPTKKTVKNSSQSKSASTRVAPNISGPGRGVKRGSVRGSVRISEEKPDSADDVNDDDDDDDDDDDEIADWGRGHRRRLR